MHELSLAEGIVQIALDEAEKGGARRVKVIFLEVGELVSVELPQLAFGIEVVARGTVAEGARVDVARPKGEAHCLECDRTIAVQARGDACPTCGTSKWLLVRGDELRVSELEVE